MNPGIIFAIVSIVCWGFGDFLIQRSTRKIGNWETLFLITLLGTIVLFPIVWKDLPNFIGSPDAGLMILIASGIFLFIAAIMEFEAFRLGKLSVIEPILSTEILVSAAFACFILRENLGVLEITLIAGLIAGLFMVSYRGKVFSPKFLLERGAIIGLFAAAVMGAANFFLGWGARETSPLLASFVINVICVVGTGTFLIYKGRLKKVFIDFKHDWKILAPMVILDNTAWIAFAFALTLAPIGIAVALSESYIIIAVLLGIFINKEKLERHQYVGLVLAVLMAIILAAKFI